MQKRLSKIVALLVALAMCFGLMTACAPDDPEPDPEPTTYTVTFDANGGTLSGSATVEVEEGAKIEGAPTAVKEGSTFNGWFDAATGGNAVDLSAYTVTADVTLYAQYTEDEQPEPELNIRLEAEDAVVDGTPSYGDTFIETVEIASGGQSVGNFGTAGNTITFTVTLEEAVDAEGIYPVDRPDVDVINI